MTSEHATIRKAGIGQTGPQYCTYILKSFHGNDTCL